MTDVAARQTLRAVLATGAASVVAFFALPSGSLGQAIAWFVPAFVATGLLLARVRAEGTSSLRLPLGILATGQFLYVGVSVLFFLGSAGVGFQRTFPSPVDGGYFVVYVLYAVTLLVVLRRSLAGRHIERRIALIDASVLTTSVAAVLWVVVIGPELSHGHSGWTVTVALLYPASGLLLFGCAAGLTLSSGVRHRPVTVLVWVWLGPAALGGFGYALQSAGEAFERGQPLMVLWVVSNTALGALAVHPRITAMLRGEPSQRPPAAAGLRESPSTGSKLRLGAVLFAAMIPLALRSLYGAEQGPRILLVISGVMFCLIIYRTSLLAGDLDEQKLLTEQLDQAVGRLRQQHDQLARYAAIVDSTDDAVITVSRTGEILDWNPGAERMYGHTREQVLGRHASLLATSGDAEEFESTMAQIVEHGHIAAELTRFRKDGSAMHTSLTASAIYDDAGEVTAVVGISRDISERMAREARFHQDSKLESLGRLSAGLAHEINTPIQFVGDNTRFLAEAYQDLIRVVLFYRGLLDSEAPLSWQERIDRMRETEEGIEFEYLQREIPSAVEQTLEGIERVSSIVRAMKTFSHPGTSEQVPADVNEALMATLTVTRYQLKDVADLELELGDLPPVMCNVADLNQVFLNLVVNAADAIEETGERGSITVRTTVDGSYAVIGITDTGGGIPADVLPKIFDPFFTTKDVGRGTGQGLALARGLVQDGHGGVLSVETTPGEGTTLTIRLPIAGRAPLTEALGDPMDAAPVPA